MVYCPIWLKFGHSAQIDYNNPAYNQSYLLFETHRKKPCNNPPPHIFNKNQIMEVSLKKYFIELVSICHQIMLKFTLLMLLGSLIKNAASHFKKLKKLDWIDPHNTAFWHISYLRWKCCAISRSRISEGK